MHDIRHSEPLTEDAFMPFGEVIEAIADRNPAAINDGTCEKFARLAQIDCAAEGGVPFIHRYRVHPLPLPIRIEKMERHLLGSQSFIPLGGCPYLVIVAPRGDFDITKIRVFRANGNQGVHYRRGVWHHFCLSLEEVSDFLVIDRESRDVDCEEITLPPEGVFEICK